MQKKNRGRLFIVSAPSGAGKTTLCQKIIKKHPHIKFSVSYTTRKPRKGEINDIDYTFIDREEFNRMVSEGKFLEWAEVHGEFYGTSQERIKSLIDKGFDVILDIDTQGALQLKEKGQKGVFIFILPPSMEALKQRLTQRMTDSQEQIMRRLKRAIEEIKTYNLYDYVIINNILEDSIKEFEAIVISNRLKTENINPLWIQETFIKQEV